MFGAPTFLQLQNLHTFSVATKEKYSLWKQASIMSCFHPWAPLDFVVNPTLHTTVVWHTDQAVCHSSSAFKCGWITGGHRPWKAEYLN